GLEFRRDGARSMGFAAASLCLALVLLAGTGLMGTARGLFDTAAGFSTVQTGMAPAGLPRTRGPLASPAISAFHGSLPRTIGTIPASSVELPGLAEAGLSSAPSGQAKATPANGDSA